MKLRIYFVLLISFVYCSIQAQTATDKIPLNPKVRSGKLANGLRYFILQNKKPENKIELRLAVNAGSIQEVMTSRGWRILWST